MSLSIGDTAPDFEAQTTAGPIRFHEWIGDSWCVLFSHPKDFTPVCTTELGYMARLQPEFDKRMTKIIGLSVDAVGDHSRWANDIKETRASRRITRLFAIPTSRSRSSTGCFPPPPRATRRSARRLTIRRSVTSS